MNKFFHVSGAAVVGLVALSQAGCHRSAGCFSYEYEDDAGYCRNLVSDDAEVATTDAGGADSARPFDWWTAPSTGDFDAGGADAAANFAWDDDAAIQARDASALPPDASAEDAAAPVLMVPVCVPVAEVCDGLDQDCDGVADNGAKKDCGVACAEACPAPVPACVPSAEVCDGKDNDCDGSVDDIAAEICASGVGECARSGRYECRGSERVCSATPGTGSAEVCEDDKDNNCDGMKNEGCPPPKPACVPVAETCDGKDEDCDGVVDNGVTKTWFRDCDNDGFAGAASASSAVKACSPPPLPSGCRAWTTKGPIDPSATDCDDNSARRHPGADYGFHLPGETADLNCDGLIEKEPAYTNFAGMKGSICPGIDEKVAANCPDPAGCYIADPTGRKYPPQKADCAVEGSGWFWAMEIRPHTSPLYACNIFVDESDSPRLLQFRQLCR
jgi:hypothetical protein